MTSNDFEELPIFSFLYRKKKISKILALDDQAVTIATQKKIPVIIYEEILDDIEIDKIQNLIAKASYDWGDSISVKNYEMDWSFLDYECLWPIIQELYFAKAVAQKLINNGKKLLVIERVPFKAPIYWYGKDNFAQAALTLGSQHIEAIQIYSNKREDSINPDRWDKVIDIEGKIVCVLNTFEIDRNIKILTSLCSTFPNKIAILALGEYRGDFKQAPVFSTPIFCEHSQDESFSSIINHQISEYNLDIDLTPHFKKILTYYCTKRWPAIKAALYRFEKLFSEQRPTIVLGTTLVDAESQIGFIAAQRLNINTLAWGHALSQGRYPFYMSKKTVIVSKYAMSLAKKDKNLQSELFACRSDYLDILHNPNKETWEDSSKFKIIALPAVCRVKGSSLFLNNIKNITRYIKNLCRIPSDLKEKVHIRFKSHPRYICRAPFDINNLDFELWNFSQDANLLTLLDDADCCLLLGENGCALVHASTRVPTIFCNIAPSPVFSHFPQYENTLLEFPHLCQNPMDLWGMIRKIIEQKDIRIDMVNAQKDWIKYDSSYPSLEEIITSELN